MSLDPYGEAAPTPTTFWRPRESERSIYTEKKIGDEMLALWETSELPADAVVTHVTLIPYRGEKAVVAWKDGRFWLPEGDVESGETAEDAVKRIALAQTGIMDPSIFHLGHFRSKATGASKTQAPGAVTYQVLYGLESGGFADFPSDPAYERRVILQRDLNTLIRSSYVERRREFVDSLDPWLLSRLKAGLR
jgi:hypothetical protein